MSQNAPKTPAERKAMERDRKRSQGLVLKQVWVRPETWPIIKDLSTSLEESPVYDESSYGRDVDHNIAYYREQASSILEQELAYAEVRVGREKAGQEVANLIRAILKIYNPEHRAQEWLVEHARKEME